MRWWGKVCSPPRPTESQPVRLFTTGCLFLRQDFWINEFSLLFRRVFVRVVFRWCFSVCSVVYADPERISCCFDGLFVDKCLLSNAIFLFRFSHLGVVLTTY